MRCSRSVAFGGGAVACGLATAVAGVLVVVVSLAILTQLLHVFAGFVATLLQRRLAAE